MGPSLSKNPFDPNVVTVALRPLHRRVLFISFTMFLPAANPPPPSRISNLQMAR